MSPAPAQRRPRSRHASDYRSSRSVAQFVTRAAPRRRRVTQATPAEPPAVRHNTSKRPSSRRPQRLLSTGPHQLPTQTVSLEAGPASRSRSCAPVTPVPPECEDIRTHTLGPKARPNRSSTAILEFASTTAHRNLSAVAVRADRRGRRRGDFGLNAVIAACGVAAWPSPA
jgi:hypothetical protein